MKFALIPQIVAELAKGRAVVVVDDESRENEGDLIFAAEFATPELLAFAVRWTSGLICVAMLGEDLERLEVPAMCARNEDSKQTAFAVSVDARAGVSTGISAHDRARTIRLLADPRTTASDLSRPGHVLPLRARSGGVLERRGHTEAATDLLRLAGLRAAGVLCELVNDDGSMARGPDLERFCERHGLLMTSVAELASYRQARGQSLCRGAAARIPTRHGVFRGIGFLDKSSGIEHFALVFGDVEQRADVLVRVHSECLTGDVFGSLRCDCGAQLNASLKIIAAAGRGAVIYVRGHEGRGIGLTRKLQAYQLQDRGLDTVDANLVLGLPADVRDYRVAAGVVHRLGIRSVRLLTNNPTKSTELIRYGLDVSEEVPLETSATPENLRYLVAKRDRMGHRLSPVDPAPLRMAVP
ncbi:MAG: 3,4-dihydroxy 2-butanone 4-phosphate synthase / cyclohydrolase [Ilumatobacteraceae bacterium]